MEKVYLPYPHQDKFVIDPEKNTFLKNFFFVLFTGCVYVHMPVGSRVHTSESTWMSEDSLQESILSIICVPRIEVGLSDPVADTFNSAILPGQEERVKSHSYTCLFSSKTAL